MKKTCLLYHDDLDGLYSAILFKISEITEIAYALSIEYGKDYSYLSDKFDNFIILDFADNIMGAKTVLWVDHHLRDGDEVNSFTVKGESPSCVSLMMENSIIDSKLLSADVKEYIDIVDSADYDWSRYKKEDILLPNINFELGKYIILNQLLRKNRKIALAENLYKTASLDVNEMLLNIEKNNNPKITKYKKYINSKQSLIEKILKNKDKYIKRVSGIPILFTKKFEMTDWKGYDFNILSYLEVNSPYVVVVFDFGREVNVQIAKNIFCEKPSKDVYSILKDMIPDPRGHKNILNLTFKGTESTILELSPMLNKLGKYL